MKGETAMKIEWGEPPERVRGRNAMYAEFSAELRKHPKRWAKHPRTFSSPHTATQSVSNQRRGVMVSFPKDEFEFTARESTVYVRYIGEPSG